MKVVGRKGIKGKKTVYLPVIAYKDILFKPKRSRWESDFEYSVYIRESKVGRLPFVLAPKSLIILTVQGEKNAPKKWLRELKSFFNTLERVSKLRIFMANPESNYYIVRYSQTKLPYSIYANLFERTFWLEANGISNQEYERLAFYGRIVKNPSSHNIEIRRLKNPPRKWLWI